NVGHQEATVVEREVVGDRSPGEAGLLVLGDDLERDIEFAADALGEGLAVARETHGGGGDGGEAGDAAALGDALHAAQRLEGAFHRLGVEGASGGDAGGEARLVLHLVDDVETAGGIPLGHQQPDGVRADVNRAEALASGRVV